MTKFSQTYRSPEWEETSVRAFALAVIASVAIFVLCFFMGAIGGYVPSFWATALFLVLAGLVASILNLLTVLAVSLLSKEA